jgi:hypothetical protein
MLLNISRILAFTKQMKNLISISFAILIFLSGMHLTIATHLCGGKVAVTKVSLSGEKASCGMESGSNNYPLTGNQITSRCCEDVISVFAVENTCTPSWVQIKEVTNNILQVFSIPVSYLMHSTAALNSSFTSVSPPNKLLTGALSLADICIFRI